LSHVGHFGDKAAQEQAAKVAKTKGGSTPNKSSTSKPPTGSTPRAPAAQKGTYIASASNQVPVDLKADNNLKGTAVVEDKEVLVDPNNPDKKLWISLNLEPRWKFTFIAILWDNLDVFTWKISDMPVIPMEVIEHKLGIDPSFKPIKQKERRYTVERCEVIRQEVNRLHEDGFIRLVDYPS
jgi:hypothetical protein